MNRGWGGLVLLTLLVWTGRARAQEDEDAACLRCHENVVAGAVRHDALDEGCTSCHEVTMKEEAPKDPRVAPHTTSLTEEEPALCQDCHDVPENPDDAHPPIDDEGCTLCHNPHSAPREHLLRDKPYQLCRQCHAETLPSGYLSLHAPVDSSCASCHDVHGNEKDKYLKATSPDLCLSCHKDIQKAVTSAYPHDPAEEDCLNCHVPHASRDVHLLNAYYPPGPYTVYTPLRYNLCWQCHDPEDVFGEDTGFRTKLGKNLHAVHVKRRKKSRLCTLCHSPHGSNQEHLLQTGIPFGAEGWVIPLKVTSNGKEKRCSAACHESRSYSP